MSDPEIVQRLRACGASQRDQDIVEALWESYQHNSFIHGCDCITCTPLNRVRSLCSEESDQ